MVFESTAHFYVHSNSKNVYLLDCKFMEYFTKGKAQKPTFCRASGVFFNPKRAMSQWTWTWACCAFSFCLPFSHRTPIHQNNTETRWEDQGYSPGWYEEGAGRGQRQAERKIRCICKSLSENITKCWGFTQHRATTKMSSMPSIIDMSSKKKKPYIYVCV